MARGRHKRECECDKCKVRKNKALINEPSTSSKVNEPSSEIAVSSSTM